MHHNHLFKYEDLQLHVPMVVTVGSQLRSRWTRWCHYMSRLSTHTHGPPLISCPPRARLQGGVWGWPPYPWLHRQSRSETRNGAWTKLQRITIHVTTSAVRVVLVFSQKGERRDWKELGYNFSGQLSRTVEFNTRHVLNSSRVPKSYWERNHAALCDGAANLPGHCCMHRCLLL